jgi:hypothetical protein
LVSNPRPSSSRDAAFHIICWLLTKSITPVKFRPTPTGICKTQLCWHLRRHKTCPFFIPDGKVWDLICSVLATIWDQTASVSDWAALVRSSANAYSYGCVAQKYWDFFLR